MKLCAKHVWSAGLLFVASGCKVGPNYQQPQTSWPESWITAQEARVDDAAQPIEQWWTTLNDATLNGLIERAVQSNLDVRLAESRVREARALRGVVSAVFWPNVDVSGSYSRRRFSESSFSADSSTALGTGAGRGSEVDLYQVGFDAFWEVDIFGGIRRSVEAAEADIGAAVESRRDVLVSLLAEVARNYVDLRSSQQRLDIAHKNIGTQKESLDISTARFNAGLVSELDVAQAKANLALTQSQVPRLESDVRQSMYAIALLLGQEPSALTSQLGSTAPIPGVPTEMVPVGLPSDLLRRRPDIRAAERQLAAATARIGVATADLFPRFSLTGSLGLSSNKAVDLFNASSHFWSFGPTASWPIFDAGRIRSNIRVANARVEQAAIQYEKAVLTSLSDVETALVAWWKEQIRRQSLVQAVEANRRAVDLANQLYTCGLTDFVNVLDSQRDLYISEDQLVQSEEDVVANLIALYKALGGGWGTFEPQLASN